MLFRSQLDTKLNLIKYLESMGMTKPFSNGADFSGISNRNDGFFISDVIHQAMVEVNEEGTTGAAATAVEMDWLGGGCDGPFKFVPDFFARHPFLFLIRDTRNGLTLFLGTFKQPTC